MARSRVREDSVRAPGPTLLIVDDDPSVIETLAPLLQLEGYRVYTALDATRGLRAAQHAKPDGIILDLRMPILDGLGFLRHLRNGLEGISPPVAVVTGDYSVDDETRAELASLGASLHFKPIWPEDLVVLARDLTAR